MKTGAEKLVMDPIDPIVTSGSKTLGVLPRYTWAADGKSIVITQGGHLRRLEISTGAVRTIDFSAKVQRTISEMARKEFRITDDAVQAQFVGVPQQRRETPAGGDRGGKRANRVHPITASCRPHRDQFLGEQPDVCRSAIAKRRHGAGCILPVRRLTRRIVSLWQAGLVRPGELECVGGRERRQWDDLESRRCIPQQPQRT